MKQLHFKCTLLSDVILNQRAASEGATKTLDFIPGSNFLGIVAGRLYKADDTSAQHQAAMLDLFHSGKVRFGDAHLCHDGKRSLKIPASFYYPKLANLSHCYIHHAIDPTQPSMRKLQLKQSRCGFYVFDNNEAKRVYAHTTCAIKSAYDRDQRRSKDEQLYVYESLNKGVALFFTVEIDEDSTFYSSDGIQQIVAALCGVKRIGRSRTAQFGLVNIENVDNYQQPESHTHNTVLSVKGSQVHIVTVYADGRLIFLDEYGLPTFQPSAEMLGLPADARILWNKSQIRTFQYSPWNYKRQCFDADRCGIEKGSVFVVACNMAPAQSAYIGSYRNEGFGRVIYNPEFLNADSEGKAQIQIQNEVIETEACHIQDSVTNLIQSDNMLLRYIGRQIKEEQTEQDICTEVNNFISSHSQSFCSESFASQWGIIRSLAILYADESDLRYYLYGECEGKYAGYDAEHAKNAGYLTHGVASEKWKEHKRINLLKEFCDAFRGNLQKALINLSSEMAKQCSPYMKKKGDHR